MERLLGYKYFSPNPMGRHKTLGDNSIWIRCKIKAGSHIPKHDTVNMTTVKITAIKITATSKTLGNQRPWEGETKFPFDIAKGNANNNAANNNAGNNNAKTGIALVSSSHLTRAGPVETGQSLQTSL